jgi:cyclophilin family peptidyl-prolyl cis-trans isomerase
MANKKKLEARMAAERKAKQARTIQVVGGGIVVLVIALGIWLFSPKTASAPSVDVPVAAVGDQTACEPFADIPAAAQYSEPPRRIDTSKQYFATVRMANGGEFVMQLYPDKAPVTVNSFVFLACKGFYNGVTFHRVLQDFMAQTGDPTGTGGGGPGYQFINEDSDLVFDKEGVVAMANAGRDTNGSQFFITFGPQAYLNGGYTIFGQVVQGMDVVRSITLRDPQTGPSFTGDVMESVTITVQ